MSDFNFYNSENDGYRGGFGDYTDPIPTSGGPVGPESQPPKKKGNGKRIAAALLACVLVGGCAGAGGAALYGRLSGSGNETTIYEQERPQVQTVVNTNKGQVMEPQ